MGELVEHITSEFVLETIQSRFGFVPKDEQVSAIRVLLEDQMDLILIAKTGFGKSIIFQAAPLMFSPVKTALIIMPLKALEEEQCRKLSKVEGCRPFVLNGDTNNPFNLLRIRQNMFTHGKGPLYI